MEIDLSAERLFVAQKEDIQIAVEVKSFAAPSVVYEFHQAIGQYLHSSSALDLISYFLQENYNAIALHHVSLNDRISFLKFDRPSHRRTDRNTRSNATANE
ncbi:MAG: element excision factor XisH family protein [Synechococcales bacterium]|nr:element excision factor XisH family protein [Synechococcales bacterium]